MSKNTRVRSGFTLIELLVVIAIIAILAAILFPVFAQARAKARSTTGQSNLKNLSLGVLMYMQDYDGVMVPYETLDKIVYNNVTQAQNAFWPYLIQPYMKSWQLLDDPSEEGYDAVWNGGSGSWPGNQERWPEYGINWNYLYITANEAGDCTGVPNGANIRDGLTPPVGENDVAQAAATVLLADVKLTGTPAGYYTSQNIDSPWGLPSDDACTYSNGGWGVGAYGDTLNYAGRPTGTGNVSIRHTQGVNVAFVDGHVKWYTPGGLAVGTDWNKTKANTAISMVDRSKYLWDRR